MGDIQVVVRIFSELWEHHGTSTVNPGTRSEFFCWICFDFGCIVRILGKFMDIQVPLRAGDGCPS
jgi:hypothetical protein